LRQIDTEALSENTLQVDAAPAYDPILLRVGAGLDKLLQCLFLLVGELRRPPGRLDVDQTVRTVLVEAVRPVPQRLPVHAADPRRLGAVHPVANRRQRQQPSRLRGILHLRREPTQLIRPKSSRRPTAAPIADLPNQSSRSEMNHAGASFQNRV